MAKRTGLGRGLDGMFTSYLGPDDNEKEKGKDSDGVNTAKTAENADSKAGKNAGNGSKKKSQSQGASDKQGKSGKAGKETVSRKKGTADSVRSEETETASENGITMLKISLVEPNREQPRKEFQEEGLNELAASIRQYGVIQPLVVQKRDQYYEIIAGERRWRAARLAGLKEVPVIIKDYNEQEIVEVSLIENIQREDLNPIEEALAYQRLLDEFSLRQEDIAKRVSKNRTTITNSLRLLKLDERVREFLIDGRLSGGHARAILGLENKDLQFEAATRAVEENLSVREVEKLVKSLQKGKKPVKPAAKNNDALDLVCEQMEEQMKAALGTKVHVNRKNSKAGRIEIEYYSVEELERIYDLIRSCS